MKVEGQREMAIDIVDKTVSYGYGDTCLTVKKNTVGDLADKTKKFSFTINFFRSSVCEGNSFDSGSKTYEYGEDYTFELSDGESLTFGSLPAGTRYNVTEAGTIDGYIPEVTVIENSGPPRSSGAKEGEAISSTAVNGGELNFAGEELNMVTFTDTCEKLTVQGVIMNNFPFMLILAAVGIILLVQGAYHDRELDDREQEKFIKKW